MSDVVYNIIYVVSAIVLLTGMAAVEIYRWHRGAAGHIVEIETDGIAFGLGGARATVELDSGETVDATVPGCVQCLGRLQRGDRVRAIDTREGYVVGLPFGLTRTKKGNAACTRETDGKRNVAA
jgi:DNA-binding beta-propeller fold protein YncE